jgi:hypothetical protein
MGDYILLEASFLDGIFFFTAVRSLVMNQFVIGAVHLLVMIAIGSMFFYVVGHSSSGTSILANA